MKHEIRLEKKGEDGVSLRDTLKQASKGRAPHPDLIGPPVPPLGRPILSWFWRLSSRRGSNGFGPLPLSFEAIDAWVRLSGEDPEPWEIHALERLDDAYLTTATAK